MKPDRILTQEESEILALQDRLREAENAKRTDAAVIQALIAYIDTLKSKAPANG